MTSSPAWQPFELYGGWVPPIFDPDSPGEAPKGRVVAVASTPSTRKGGWAARAVIEMARGWAAQGARVFLADLTLGHPEVHTILGLENGEGLSDALVYGASIKRIARPVDDGAFFVGTAGTIVHDPDHVLTHPRWSGIADGFLAAGVTLVLFLPAEAPGARSLVDRSSTRVLLARPGESPEEVLGEENAAVTAILGPDGTLGEYMDAPLPVPAEEPEPALQDPLSVDPLAMAGARSRETAGLPVEEGTEAIARAIPEPRRSRPAASKPQRPPVRRGPGVLTLVLLLVLMAVVFVAARMGFVEIPFLSATPGDEPAPSEPVSFAGSGPEATAPDETQVARAASAAAAPSATAPPRPTGTDTSAVSGGDTGAADGGAADEGAPAPGTPGDPATPPVAGAGLQYSVAVSAWRRMDAAMGQVRAWERRRPDLVFVAAPVEVRGILYFRVLAGPASTVPEGEALRSRLAAEMSEPGADDWMVRRTHLAFALGDHPTLEAARGHASRLQRDGIPAYVLRIPGDGVTVSFRVYAGAYRNEAEAETLRRLLVERNVEHSPLTDRTGDIPG